MEVSNISVDEKENNGNLVNSSTLPKTKPPLYYQQPQVCPCQRLLLCPGSMLPSFSQTTPTESSKRFVSRGTSEYASVNPKAPMVASADDVLKRRAEHNLNCRCRQPPSFPISTPECCCRVGMPILNSMGARTGRKDNANHIYVNLKYLQETAAAAMLGQGIPGKLIPYYANLHFLQTLSLYENAEILDVRPSHLIPNPISDSTIPEDSEAPPVETVPKRPKKRIETPLNNGVYEMMSFNQAHIQSATGGNYLLMQPGTSDNRELIVAETSSPSVSSSKSNSSDTIISSGTSSTETGSTTTENTVQAAPEAHLPLRPFMPVLLPFHDHTCDLKNNHECDETCKSSCTRKCSGEYCRSSRSNSLGDIKVSIIRRDRASSTDGRQEGVHSEEMGGYQHASCSTASPKSTPRKHPLLTKLTLRSKEKSFSTDEITPPSSAPSSPDSLFLESIQKYPFHRSADCLQLTEECRLSEEDLSQDPEVIMSQSMDKSITRTPMSIKRSSSVPCKTANQQSQHSASSTDSGISTHLPNSLGGQGAVFSHFIAYHSSLPRRHSGNAASRHPVPERKIGSTAGEKPTLAPSEQKPVSDQSKMILISECKQCHQFVTSPEGVLVLDTKSMTSSSSSDMSDYIESLSLCSRSSSGSASSGCGGVGASEYIRNDDLCSALMTIPTSCTSSLRPRSGKEYHSFDRVLIQDGCPYIPITDCSQLNLSCLKPFMDDTERLNPTEGVVNDNVPENTNNNINNNINTNKMNSPSPGYISCSPGNVDFLSSPERTTQFTFPKESSKELNYLEVVSVGESEPSSPVVKQSTVQYAVIDMVATAAARKLSTERAQLRNEGRSPTPTESGPRHACIDESVSNDKK